MEPVNAEFAEHFKKIADEAAARDLIISIKPHTGNTATAGTIMKTLEEIGKPNAGGSYDPGNVQYYEGVNAAEDFPLMAAKTHSLLIKDHKGKRADRVFPIPGEGDVDFPKIFKTLKEVQFDGNIVVERVSSDFSDAPEVIDEYMIKTRENLERMLEEAGLEYN